MQNIDTSESSSARVEMSPTTIFIARASRNFGFVFGAGVLAAVLIVALSAPFVVRHDPYLQDLSIRLMNPIWAPGGSWAYPLGTDEFGRDYLSRLIYGARTSLLIGTVATLIAGVIGTTLGVSAGIFGGRIDAFITLLINVRLAMPGVLVALAVVSMTGSSTTIVTILLGLLLWDRFAVVVRSAAIQIRGMDYIRAAKALGCSNFRLIAGEVMPNIASVLIVVSTLEFAHAILSEAALSFLGLGVPAPTPTWGLMISEGKRYLLFKPWLVCIPGAALFFVVMAINLLGDAVRDILTPEGRT